MKLDRLSLIAVATIVILGVAALVYFQEDTGTDVLSDAKTDVVGEIDTGISRAASPERGTPDLEVKPDSPGAGQSKVHDIPPASADCANVVGRVVNKKKEGIAKAVVALCLDISDFRSRGRVGKVVEHVLCDDEGYFQLPNVHVGEVYSLRAESPNYASKFLTNLKLEAGGNKNYELIMHKGISIRGLVTDLSDVPIAGAKVYVQDVGMQITDKVGGIERETYTDDQGRWVLENLNQGFKNLAAAKPNFATKQMFNYHVNHGQSARETILKMGPGEGLRGRVVNAQDEGIEGVEITAQPINVRSRQLNRNFHMVRSDAEGGFFFAGLKKGDYYLTCKKLGYYSPLLRDLAQTSGPDAVIRLLENPKIIGRVIDAETHEPIKEFTLFSTPRESLLFVSENAKQHFKSEDGTFEFRCFRNEGDVFLHLECKTHANGVTDRLVLKKQKSIEGIVIEANKGVTAIGRIVDPEKNPIAGAFVEMETIPEGTEGLGKLGSMVYGQLALLQRKVKTDKKGRFRLSRLRAATYRLKVSHGSHAKMNGDRLHKIKGGGELDLGDVVLLKGGHLMGVAFDSDGQPMPNIMVKLVPEDSTRTGSFDIETRSNGKGAFDFKHLAAGGYKLQVIRTARLAEIAGQIPNLPTSKYMSVFIAEGEEKKIEVRGL